MNRIPTLLFFLALTLALFLPGIARAGDMGGKSGSCVEPDPGPSTQQQDGPKHSKKKHKKKHKKPKHHRSHIV